MSGKTRLGRRAFAAALGTLTFATERAFAFGEAGAFRARLLAAGKGRPDAARVAGTARWGSELVRRTSAPAHEEPETVAADRSALFREPFAVWCGTEDVGALSLSEVGGLERFLRLGGTLVVDDSDPVSGAFGRSVRRELLRALPESPPVQLEATHVLFKTFYLLDRPYGRVLGPPRVEAIVRGRNAVVLFLAHDLLGALARHGDGWAYGAEPGGAEQREHAIRFAVNIAMYVLCSDYKDDVVHAPFLLQRRGRAR